MNGGQLFLIVNTLYTRSESKTDSKEVKPQTEDLKSLKSQLKDKFVVLHQTILQELASGMKLSVPNQLLEATSLSETHKKNAYISHQLKYLDAEWIHLEAED